MNVFFLFAGTRTRRKCFAQGTFRCPACGVSGTYERCRASEWVHLYWIPLFKVGGEEEVVVCGSCNAALAPAVVEGGDRGAGDRRRGGSVGPWTCDRCGNVNPVGDETCLRCGARRS
jgi:hypothetical protein